MKDMVIKNNSYEDTKTNKIFILGIFIFTFGFCTINTFLSSPIIKLLVLSLSLVVIIFSIIMFERKVTVSIVDIMWLLFLTLLVLNITLNNLITSKTIADILIYSFCVGFLLLTKVNINLFGPSFNFIKLIGIIYALSAIFQYLYTDIYMSVILPLFSPTEQYNIINLLRGNSYSGFTNQNAHLAGYIVNSIGLIVFSSRNTKLFKKILSILFFSILIIGLLLTTKRAHLIFMILAVLITVLVSINNKKLFSSIVKLIIIIVTFTLIIYFLFNATNFDEESPILSFSHELKDTFIGIVEGEDVTNGRSILYGYSWYLFTKEPIFGIGWTEFINNSAGLIQSGSGSHPHNIYLQLLTELGLIGFLFFVIPVTYLYYKTFSLLRRIGVNNNLSQKWKHGIQYAFFSQTFFLLYGFTGNPLTDHNFLIMYFFACSISLSALVNLKYK